MGEDENYFDSIYRNQQQTSEPTPLEAPAQEGEATAVPGASGATAAKPREGLSPWLLPLAVGLVILLGFGALLFSRYHSRPAPTPTPTPTPGATSTPSVPSAAPTSEIMPLLQAYPQAPKVSAGMVKVTATGGKVVATSGRTLTVTGAKITSASNPCVVQEATDFCMVGVLHAPVPQSVYFIKDAAHSRLFANQNGYKAVKVAGAPAAALLRLTTGSQGQMPVFVVVNKDSSGWMFVSSSPTQAPLDIANQVTVS